MEQKYYVPNNVTKEDFLKNGFVKTTKSFVMKRKLYSHIVLILKVDKETYEIVIEVNKISPELTPYHPFYNSEENNNVSKIVKENYDKEIQRLITCGILSEIE